jgi:hypothetical protein
MSVTSRYNVLENAVEYSGLYQVLEYSLQQDWTVELDAQNSECANNGRTSDLTQAGPY